MKSKLNLYSLQKIVTDLSRNKNREFVNFRVVGHRLQKQKNYQIEGNQDFLKLK